MVLPLPRHVFTCVSLHPPGFELDEGVGEDALVLFQAAVADIAAHVHLAQDAQGADLGVVFSVALRHKHQAPEQ